MTEEPRRPADPPASPAEALARARRHGRAAAAEALAALQALLDATSLAASGETAETQRALAPLVRLIEALQQELEDVGPPGSASLLQALAEALDSEIARWEARGGDDPEARAVLRAFLGLRELMWELGVRRPGRPDGERRRPRRRTRNGAVERVPVESP